MKTNYTEIRRCLHPRSIYIGDEMFLPEKIKTFRNFYIKIVSLR